MPLSNEQVVKSIQKPANGPALSRAQLDNNRQRFHAVTATGADDAGPYVEVLKERVKKMLDNDVKYARFCSLLDFPLPSTRLIDKGADEYGKVFGAQDRFSDYEFTDEALKADAAQYLDEIKFRDFFQKDLFNQCLRASATFWVVDLPSTVNTEGYARPQVLLREFGAITDVSLDSLGNVVGIIYPLPVLKDAAGNEVAKRYAVIDDESYRVYVQYNAQTEATPQLINPHGLNRCPAGFIWHDKLDNYKPLRIQSPLHTLFTDLDWYVIGNIFRQHADLYSAFPIFWAYKSGCTYVDAKSGSQCNSGFIDYTVTEKDENDLDVTVFKQKPCPVCSARKPIGPGSEIEVPTPQAGADSPDLREPAGFINSEVDLLDYNARKLDALKGDINEGLTGDSNNVDQTKEAVNADQVEARYQARKSIVHYWGENLEQTELDIVSVMLALRYGPQFVRYILSYGTEYHLLSTAQAIDDYKNARAASLPMYQLAIRRRKIDNLLAGGSAVDAERNELMSLLEPYADLPLSAIPVGSDAWELKANFAYYIERFERENFGLVTFGKLISPAEKLNLITNILYGYVAGQRKRTEIPIAEPTDGGAGFGSK